MIECGHMSGCIKVKSSIPIFRYHMYNTLSKPLFGFCFGFFTNKIMQIFHSSLKRFLYYDIHIL